MKKLLMGAILALFMALGSIVSAQDGELRALGGGFEAKTRVSETRGKMILTRFPARCRVKEGTVAEFKAFDACGDTAVMKVFKLRRPVKVKKSISGLTITVRGVVYNVIPVVGDQGELAGLGFIDTRTIPKPEIQ